MAKRGSGFRNPVARSPLLRKGGVHQKSKTGQRVQARLALHSVLEEWLDEPDIANHNQEQNIGEQTLPDVVIGHIIMGHGIPLNA